MELFVNFQVAERPLFMQEPRDTETVSPVCQENHNGNESPLPLRTSSYKEAVTKSAKHFCANIPVQQVRAGFHANLRLFIALTGQVFFVKQQKDILSKHVCHLNLFLFREFHDFLFIVIKLSSAPFFGLVHWLTFMFLFRDNLPLVFMTKLLFEYIVFEYLTSYLHVICFISRLSICNNYHVQPS